MKHPTCVENIPLWNIILDLFILSLSLTTSVTLAHITPTQRGFFCDDDSIRYPYKSSTINDAWLYSVSTTLPVTTIVGLELWLRGRRGGGRGARDAEGRVAVAGWSVPVWAARCLRHVLLFGYGLGAQEFLVHVAKYTVGRLRPHFLAVCRPSVLCNDTGIDPHAYITDYECTGVSGFAADQIRLSFPSGHSAMSIYAAIFVVLYVERRVRWPPRLMVCKTAFEVVVVAMGWFCAMTRIMNHKHHSEDVAVGSALGALVAWFWVEKVLRIRTEEEDTGNCNSVGGGGGGGGGLSETNTFIFPAPANSPEVQM